jgi:hypothetical protein
LAVRPAYALALVEKRAADVLALEMVASTHVSLLLAEKAAVRTAIVPGFGSRSADAPWPYLRPLVAVGRAIVEHLPVACSAPDLGVLIVAAMKYSGTLLAAPEDNSIRIHCTAHAWEEKLNEESPHSPSETVYYA